MGKLFRYVNEVAGLNVLSDGSDGCSELPTFSSGSVVGVVTDGFFRTPVPELVAALDFIEPIFPRDF
jgi:hypothetical protein